MKTGALARGGGGGGGGRGGWGRVTKGHIPLGESIKKKQKPQKSSWALVVLGGLIALVMLLTIVVGYDLSESLQLSAPKGGIPFGGKLSKKTLGIWNAVPGAPHVSVDTIPIHINGAHDAHHSHEGNTVKSEMIAVTAPPIHSTPAPVHPNDLKATTIVGQVDSGNAPLEATRRTLRAHPLIDIMSRNPQSQVEDVLVEMQKYEKCKDKPLVITMAKIGTPLYWQLVENFIYSMDKFDIVECALMVCIADPHCMQLCDQSGFPCYQYDDHSGDISTFQKIANLKLYALPLASAKGVNIFMVDLDVGFRQNPMLLVEDFMRDPQQDILVQKDVSFVMNRTVAGWRTWYTKPVVNIGLFVFKGNYKVEFMFKRAWRIYQNHGHRLDQPGTDQSIIQDCLHKSHDNKKVNLTWGFFPDSQVVLVDKIYKFETQNIELGGEIADSVLTSKHYKRDAIAVHATCYEMKVKVPALKAVGAFWNPQYYDPNRRTLTMKLYYHNSRRLRSHLNALAWLAMATNRSLIVPNLMADESLFHSDFKHANLTAEGHVLWPGWRVMKLMDDHFPLNVVEPGYYWRVRRHYVKDEKEIPAPFILSTFDTGAMKLYYTLKKYDHEPRVVLNVMAKNQVSSPLMQSYIEDTLRSSVRHSVGIFSNYSFESSYSPALVPVNVPVPHMLFNGEVVIVEKGVRACAKILYPKRGNRSCFDKCK